MRKALGVAAAGLLAVVLALAPLTAHAGGPLTLGDPLRAPLVIVPAPVYAYPPAYYYPPPLVTFGTWWDPDYRAIRYNQYFQRYQEQPRIYGFTLR